MSGTFKSKIFVVLSIAALSATSSGRAQGPTSTTELVACLNDKLVNQGNVDMSAAVEKCMPQGCKVTASMSTASAQPACNIAGTQLPRVYLNCPGPAAGLRFRPTFTLCPNDANRIEVGEDVAPIAPSPAVPMQMANIEIPMNQPILHALSNYLNTPNNNLRCTRCHGNASPGVTGDTPLLSSPFDPFTIQRRNLLPFVIYSNEPTRKALVAPSATVAGDPVTAQTLDQICARIQSVLESNPFCVRDSLLRLRLFAMRWPLMSISDPAGTAFPTCDAVVSQEAASSSKMVRPPRSRSSSAARRCSTRIRRKGSRSRPTMWTGP